MNPLEVVHDRFQVPRRARILAARVADLLPPDASVLDVGSGDGRIAALVAARRPDIRIRGVDVLVRGRSAIAVEPFDGRTLPFADRSFDAVTLIDVVHHASDPDALLAEAARVARTALVVKDHVQQGLLARPTLRFMDRVGNRRFGVRVPADYWSEMRWREAIAALGLRPAVWERTLALYPWPLDAVFGRRLHLLARLERA